MSTVGSTQVDWRLRAPRPGGGECAGRVAKLKTRDRVAIERDRVSPDSEGSGFGRPAGAARLRPPPARVRVTRWVLEQPGRVASYLHMRYFRGDQEVSGTLYLKARNQLIGEQEHDRGTLACTAVKPRAILRGALEHRPFQGAGAGETAVWKYGVHPVQISQWKRHLLDHVAEVFAPGSRAARAAEQLQVEPYEQIGRLKMELEWVKKSFSPRLRRSGSWWNGIIRN
ncbi:MAG: hypothetical protein GY854_12630 [Deltaproteobacteria bacterium]|nr:hypothetical protein [Deltaproteobacteria bacterium]